MSQPPVSVKKKRRRRRRRGPDRALVVLCVLLFFAAGVYGFIRAIVKPPELPDPDPLPPGPQDDVDGAAGQDPGEDAQEPPKPVFTRKDLYFTILVSGLDDDNGGDRKSVV